MVQVVVAVIGAAVLSAPWWATVLSQHGLAPFRAVVGSALVDVIAREGASRDLNTRVEEYVRWLKF